MLKTILIAFKNYRTPIFIMIGALACFWFGAHLERLEANEEIALLEKDYAARESSALWAAENIRKQQEQKYLSEMDNLKRINSELTADAQRVREQFNRLKSSRSTNNQSSDQRASRCDSLLSEAYSLAGEGESLLRDRDARFEALK